MKAVIWAGGLGTRLRLKHKPKPMVKVNGKPILEHIIDHLNKHGITEIIVKVHYKSEVIMKYFGSRVLYYYEPKLLDNEQSEENLYQWLGNKYIVMNGDTLTNIDITKLIDRDASVWFWNFDKYHYAGTKFVNKKTNTLYLSRGNGAYYFDCNTKTKLARARRFYRKLK